jgi:coenzyme F420-0:L-glutamate ligase/coenzyme F420-1:gamma-L-glutamate ligase
VHGIVSILDPLHHARVETIWRQLKEVCGLAGIEMTPIPHFSWQIALHYDIDRLVPEMRTIASRLEPFQVHATGLAIFPGEQPVVYIPVVRSAHLSTIHQLLWDCAEAMSIGLHAYYSPAQWLPHITLACGDVDQDKLACAMQTLAFQELDWEIDINNLTLFFQDENQAEVVEEHIEFAGVSPSAANAGAASRLQAFLRSRCSVRHFLPRAVPTEILIRVLETATWAPSAHNRQPWRFGVISTPAVKERLAACLGDQFFLALQADGKPLEEIEALVGRSRQKITQAPVVVVLCLDRTVADPYPDAVRQQAEFLMGVQSLALAGGTLLLAAHAEGLGGVWICAPLFAPQTVQQALDLPAEWDPQGMLLLGYPATRPKPRARLPLEAVTRFL